ncbi:tetratricopeptide repeat protein [Sphingomonas dokdonensis]|uniref:Tetratricopeptide repeat protein n=1 Tax=Sphingomonas dokdonensis TaxID=344880 RepID=A0A245ZEC8_9SPHN|nr:hypothetical protein [Sphingomonas dokdonensis]OWK28069.1 hypothetical protein SPDO_29020 [Sphingomonas dokdonensis]
MSLLLLLLAQAASNDIVITGKRLEEAHAICKERGCTPLRDAQASIALAEARFRTGDYLAAKSVLAGAVSRNKDKAASDPKPVAAIYEAYATVALHEGNQGDYRKAVANQVRTLRDNLPPDDPNVLAATTALGDMWLKTGTAARAEMAYRSSEEAALAAGNDRAAMLAGMKRAWLLAATDKPRQARAKLDELDARAIAAQPGYATALRVLRLRLAAKDAEGPELDRLIRSLGQGQDEAPVLLKAPAYALDAAAERAAARDRARKFGDVDPDPIRSSELDAIQWADFGFWIRPNGETADAEVLRSSRGNPWTALVLEQIAGRRYSARPAGADDDVQGYYKVERLTRRSQYRVPSGSLISRRVAIGGYETLDLTEEADAGAPPTR